MPHQHKYVDVVGNAVGQTLIVRKMKNPIISLHQGAVGQAHYLTGHVLKTNGQLFKIGDNENDVFEIFDSLDQAKNFIIQKITDRPDNEFWVVDHNGKTIFFYDKNGERQLT